MALGYLLMSIDPTYKEALRRERCPTRVWKLLKEIFQAVSDASIDLKLSKQHIVLLKGGVMIILYSKNIFELVNEMESTGNLITEIERKPSLLRGLPNESMSSSKKLWAV